MSPITHIRAPGWNKMSPCTYQNTHSPNRQYPVPESMSLPVIVKGSRHRRQLDDSTLNQTHSRCTKQPEFSQKCPMDQAQWVRSTKNTLNSSSSETFVSSNDCRALELKLCKWQCLPCHNVKSETGLWPYTFLNALRMCVHTETYTQLSQPWYSLFTVPLNYSLQGTDRSDQGLQLALGPPVTLQSPLVIADLFDAYLGLPRGGSF